MQGELTHTPFVSLALLVSRNLLASEIGAQMGRGFTEVWSRAERHCYNAPRRFPEQGMVTARVATTGRRQRTVYSIP